MTSETMAHAMQLEAAFQWFHANSNEESRERLNTRDKWFAAMKRINCIICEQPLEAERY